MTEQRSWGINERGPLFAEQDIYEIVELQPKAADDLHIALSLLKEVFERERGVSWSLADKIEKFLLDHKVDINYEG